MTNMEMKSQDKIFKNIVFREFINLMSNDHALHSYSRQIKFAALRGKGLKELSTNIRIEMNNRVDYLLKIIDFYAKKYGKESFSIKEKHDLLIKDLIEWIKNTNNSDKIEYSTAYSNFITRGSQGVLENDIFSIREVINEIDKTINYIRTYYKIPESNDERFPKTTIKDIMVSSNFFSDNFGTYKQTFDNEDYTSTTVGKIEISVKTDKKDIFNADYGKKVIESLRSMKSDVISAANKYYGRNSKFTEFNLSELIDGKLN